MSELLLIILIYRGCNSDTVGQYKEKGRAQRKASLNFRTWLLCDVHSVEIFCCAFIINVNWDRLHDVTQTYSLCMSQGVQGKCITNKATACTFCECVCEVVNCALRPLRCVLCLLSAYVVLRGNDTHFPDYVTFTWPSRLPTLRMYSLLAWLCKLPCRTNRPWPDGLTSHSLHVQ